jgi:hypothetical protein
MRPTSSTDALGEVSAAGRSKEVSLEALSGGGQSGTVAGQNLLTGRARLWVRMITDSPTLAGLPVGQHRIPDAVALGPVWLQLDRAAGRSYVRDSRCTERLTGSRPLVAAAR